MKRGTRSLAHIAGDWAILADHVPRCHFEGLASRGAVGAEGVQLRLRVRLIAGHPVGVLRRHAFDDAVRPLDAPLGAREATQAEGVVIGTLAGASARSGLR